MEKIFIPKVGSNNTLEKRIWSYPKVSDYAKLKGIKLYDTPYDFPSAPYWLDGEASLNCVGPVLRPNLENTEIVSTVKNVGVRLSFHEEYIKRLFPYLMPKKENGLTSYRLGIMPTRMIKLPRLITRLESAYQKQELERSDLEFTSFDEKLNPFSEEIFKFMGHDYVRVKGKHTHEDAGLVSWILCDNLEVVYDPKTKTLVTKDIVLSGLPLKVQKYQKDEEFLKKYLNNILFYELFQRSFAFKIKQQENGSWLALTGKLDKVMKEQLELLEIETRVDDLIRLREDTLEKQSWQARR